MFLDISALSHRILEKESFRTVTCMNKHTHTRTKQMITRKIANAHFNLKDIQPGIMISASYAHGQIKVGFESCPGAA